MARRPRIHAPGLLYHAIVRGNQRRRTFRADPDYRAYLNRLAHYRAKFGVKVIAYCLMPNHVHLLLEVSREPLSKFMQGLQQSYTQYFNRRHHKTGHVFQGRYRAIVCDKDEYLLTLVRYIHLNPVRAKLARSPQAYRYSGHGEYCGSKGSGIIESTLVLKMLGGAAGYRRFVRDGMADGHREDLYEATDQRFLGPDALRDKLAKENEPDERSPKNRKALAGALEALAAKLRIDAAALTGPDRSWSVSKTRVIAAYVLVRRCGYRLTEVAAALHRDPATVSSLISKLGYQIGTDRRLNAEIDKLQDC